MRILAYIIVLLGWTGAGLGAYIAANALTDAFEDLTLRTVSDALAAAGQTWPEVDPDGLRVVLRGTAPSEAAQLRARDVAEQALGATRVADLTTIGAATRARELQPELEILRAGPTTTLTGRLGESTAFDAVAGLRDRLDGTLTALHTTTPTEIGSGWVEIREVAFDLAPRIDTGRIEATPSGLSVSAMAGNREAADAMEAALREVIPDSVTATVEIEAPAPLFTPFTFAARREDGAWVVETCNLPLMQTTGATVARLTAAGLPPDADCAQGRGTPSPDWVRAVETLVRWLAQYPTATVDLRDLSATLTSASPATAPALPAGFAVDLAAPAPVPTEAPEADTRILFTRHAGGSVTLSGATPDALTRDAIVSYAEGRFGAAKVTSMIGVRDGIPPRDTAQLLAALDLLALLDEGSVRAHNGALSLTGVGGTPDIPARVSEASADLPVTLDVRYRPRAEQRAARAATCAEDLTAAQTDARIQFAPSSTALTAESAAVLDAIATILRACDGQRFEIAGYTDNQGSESMNLTLSKARAEAVLDALLARDVFLDRMVAMGYGEADPIADNDTEEGRSRNRRIEFRPLTEGE